MITHIAQHTDKGLAGILLALDLKKAFDTVDHSILIGGAAVHWFRQYLNGRTQFIRINGVSSRIADMRYGVPQGSILGSTLFLVYMNSLSNLCLNGSLQLYADDTCLIYFSNTSALVWAAVEENLNEISQWLKYYKLTLNTVKSEYMVISKKQEWNNLQINLNGAELKRSTCVKYLGLYIDSQLTWEQHILQLCKKISPAVGILGRITKYLPLKYRKLLYFSLVPHLSYLTLIWTRTSLYRLKPLQILQNRAIKRVFNLPLRHPTNLLYRPNGILDINMLSTYQTCVFIHNCSHSNIHSSMQLISFNQIHNYDTRNSGNFRTANIRTLTGQRSILSDGLRHYNVFPLQISTLPPRHFEIAFKKHLWFA